jgi:hypothetical protein
MSKTSLPRRVPVGLLVTPRRDLLIPRAVEPPPRNPAPIHIVPTPVLPARWVWPAVVAVAFVPFVLTAVGLATVALRPTPRPVVETTALLVTDLPIVPEPSPSISVDEVVPDPIPVEPGEARPPLKGMRPLASEEVTPTPEPVPVPTTPAKCERFGTAIDFVRSPALAFPLAAREQKLVMVLHLAGNFDDPGFT